MQRLADQAVSDAATRVQLAAALRDAEEARRSADGEQRAQRAHRLSPTLVAVSVLSLVVAGASLVDRWLS